MCRGRASHRSANNNCARTLSVDACSLVRLPLSPDLPVFRLSRFLSFTLVPAGNFFARQMLAGVQHGRGRFMCPVVHSILLISHHAPSYPTPSHLRLSQGRLESLICLLLPVPCRLIPSRLTRLIVLVCRVKSHSRLRESPKRSAPAPRERQLIKV